MNVAAENASVRLDFRLDDQADVYVATLICGAESEPLATTRLDRAVVDRVVFQAARIGLEVRAGGLFAAYADAASDDALVKTSIKQLIEEAVALMAPEDAAAELATLERVLLQALDVISLARARGNAAT